MSDDEALEKMSSIENYEAVNTNNHTMNDSKHDDEIPDEEMDPLTDSVFRDDAFPRRSTSSSSSRFMCYLFGCWVALVLSLVLGAGLWYVVNVNGPSSSSSSPLDPSLTKNGASGTKNHDETAPQYIAYDPTVGAPRHSYNEPYTPDLFPPQYAFASDDNENDEPILGYAVQPDVVNNTVVFVADGDLYWTRLDDPHPTAIRLTFTVGNVRTPKIHPHFPYLICFTATYEARREVYLLDLSRRPSSSGNRPAQRLTYFDSAHGVSSIAGWHDNSIVFAAVSHRVSLRDLRLYEYNIDTQVVTDVPLSQATDGVQTSDCLYFVRYRQGSFTNRYVGGTAESLWAYCDGQPRAVSLTHDYIGTSKAPRIARFNNQDYFLFLSDRSPNDGKGPKVFESGAWRATTMNLWAAPLPKQDELYGGNNAFVLDNNLIQLTRVSCQFDGLALQEFSVDPVTNVIVLRVGADLYQLAPSITAATLNGGKVGIPTSLNVQIVSDYNGQHERLISVSPATHLDHGDVFETDYDTVSFLMTIRGQTWVAPVVDDTASTIEYEGVGQNIPARRYRVIPGAMTGGSIRVLKAVHVPLYEDEDNARRVALVLATDPLSDTAEHAFYVVEVQSDHKNAFIDLENLPEPFIGGHVNGGSVKAGGLGSVDPDNFKVSPCGRRFAWTDTDNRICVMSTPMYNISSTYQCLPRTNNAGEPMSGTLSTLSWSPGGRYLGIEHNALNEFAVLSIADCGDPASDIKIGQIVQLTQSRYNSYGMFWGQSTFDIFVRKTLQPLAGSLDINAPDDVSSTIFFLSDRDIISEVHSPWGSRVPMPHFESLEGSLYSLPLPFADNDLKLVNELMGRYSGGGSLELFANSVDEFKKEHALSEESNDDRRRRLKREAGASVIKSLRGRGLSDTEKGVLARYLEDTLERNTTASPFPEDAALNLPVNDLVYQGKPYRIAQISKGKHIEIVSQTMDDGSLLLRCLDDDDKSILKLYSASSFPSDAMDVSSSSVLTSFGLSTSRKHIYAVSPTGQTAVFANTGAGIAGFIGDSSWSNNQASVNRMAISVWPALEYRQMFGDAWRMLRDFFYDDNLHSVNWEGVHARYLPLVERCSKREDLDSLLGQMASELSALHSFVYGGEYIGPNSPPLAPASLGVTLKRSPQWKGFEVVEVPQRDPDFDLINGDSFYCPVSDQTLLPTGQKGLQEGDIIVALNGESVMHATHINMMLRGTDGKSVRLEVARRSSVDAAVNDNTAVQESLIAVPIAMSKASALRYDAWEWKTRQLAKRLAKKAGFSVGYVHMQAMDRDGEDAFARGFFPDFDKEGLIIDVRNNNGGNIDSWILTFLQRKAWMYWAGRGVEKRTGELDWDEQFAFRGKIVVLINEHTSSNGEGIARGISELGMGILIGRRTWGGGIWGSSANHLVDGGIAAAPQWGTFNERLGWGGGVEMTGVSPDIEVDNDPRMTFDGRDEQLERAISELEKMLKEEPVASFHTPGKRPDMSLHNDDCPA